MGIRRRLGAAAAWLAATAAAGLAAERRIAALEAENRRLHRLIDRPEGFPPTFHAVDLTLGILALINADRLDHGRRPLALDSQLTWVATWRASDMATRDYLRHIAPDGASAAEVLDAFGGLNVFVGENIWSCADHLTCTAQTIHETFSSSPGHRENQLLPRYTSAGFGFMPDPRGNLFVCELFSDQDSARLLAGSQGRPPEAGAAPQSITPDK